MIHAILMTTVAISVLITAFVAFVFRIQKFWVLGLVDFVVAFLAVFGVAGMLLGEDIGYDQVAFIALGFAVLMTVALGVLRLADRKLIKPPG